MTAARKIEDGFVYRFLNKDGSDASVGKPVELVELYPDLGGIARRRTFAGVIQTVNVDDGTVDVAYASGALPHVPRRAPDTKYSRITWQWPGANEPPDPEPPERK